MSQDIASRVVLGAMNFGKRTPEAEALRILSIAAERGVHLVDTANAYNGGESERIVGRALASHPGKLRVATKVGFGRQGGKPEGLSKARVIEAADESLRRLGLERVDLYYLHVPDHTTPIGETLDALQELLQKGKIAAFGVSNYASWQIVDIDHQCDARGMPRPTTSQVLYNLLIRQLDLEYRRFTRAFPIHTTVFNPLAGGLLAGHHDRCATTKGSRFDNNAMYQRRYFSDRFFDLVDAYRKLARSVDRSLLELAYSFVAETDFVDSVIVGPGTVRHFEEALDALAKPLPQGAREEIDSIARAFAGTDTSYAR